MSVEDVSERCREEDHDRKCVRVDSEPIFRERCEEYHDENRDEEYSSQCQDVGKIHGVILGGTVFKV